MKVDTKKIQRARHVRGWTKAKLATVAGINPSTVRRVEEAEYLTPQTVKKIADALGLTMEELVLDEEEGAA
jgi:ribosome-binding protein aMBF1 (putative translation factor)